MRWPVLVLFAWLVAWNMAAAGAGAAPAPPQKESGKGGAGAAPLTLPPAQVAETKKIGLRLIKQYQRGALRFVRVEREKAQMKQLAYRGYITAPDGKPVLFSPALLRTVDFLAAHSTPKKPLVILSLFRGPAPHRNARSAHGRGAALDIWAYGGYTINSRDRSQCVAGVLAVIKALPPRPYRLGLPKPPGTDPQGLRPPPWRPASWPFFPAPLPRVIRLFNIPVVMPRRDESGKLLMDRRRGYVQPEVLRWANERSAPLSHVGSPRVRRAIRDAQKRGANIHALFPDALDHLHIDVMPPR